MARATRPGRRRTPRAATTATKQVTRHERQLTVIEELHGQGVYKAKDIMRELERRGLKLGRTQLWKAEAELDAENDHDFGAHRTRLRWHLFNRHARNERDAARTIDEFRAIELTNAKVVDEWRKQVDAAVQLHEPFPPPPVLRSLDYTAKAAMLKASTTSLEHMASIAGIATEVVEVQGGDLSDWGAAAREGGLSAVDKRFREQFPDLADGKHDG